MEKIYVTNCIALPHCILDATFSLTCQALVHYSQLHVFLFLASADTASVLPRRKCEALNHLEGSGLSSFADLWTAAKSLFSFQ